MPFLTDKKEIGFTRDICITISVHAIVHCMRYSNQEYRQNMRYLICWRFSHHCWKDPGKKPKSLMSWKIIAILLKPPLTTTWVVFLAEGMVEHVWNLLVTLAPRYLPRFWAKQANVPGNMIQPPLGKQRRLDTLFQYINVSIHLLIADRFSCPPWDIHPFY